MAMSPDLTAIRRILNQDPVWAAYAIADLQPSFAPYCHWATGDSAESEGAESEGAEGEGVVLLFTALDLPLLLTVGAADAVGTALAKLPLPPKVYISTRKEHFGRLAEHYSFSQPLAGTVVNAMYRMAWQRPDQFAASTQVSRLGPADGPRIQALYAFGGPYTPDAFDPYQLADGTFFGINGADGALVAVGGTHIVDWQAGIAAIGNMYTQPAQRGQGHARAVLGAIVATLQARGVTNIVLNVNQENQTARRLYEQYGFAIHCPFLEGVGIKHNL